MPGSTQDEILKKYSKMMEDRQAQITPLAAPSNSAGFSSEFAQFKTDMMPQFSRYERWCNNIGGVLTLKLSSKDQERISKDVEAAHLDVSPSQVVSLAMLSFFAVVVFGLLFTVSIYLFSGNFSVLLVFLSFITAGFLFYYFYTMPNRLANQWRLKAGSQMVPCILYTVIYMKHTSNLERAIRFASQHLEPPLALDLGKVFWDVETGRYSTIKESLDVYLETWRGINPEFVESFNLIESSLYEPSEARRVQILERALQVILDGVYDKMLKYTHSVKTPLTNIYMLGIVLPTLALALIPLASALMGGLIKWYIIMVLFNLIVPFFVFYLTNEVMTQRPGGYGESSILERNPLYAQYTSRKPYIKAAFICVPILLLGLLPYIFHYTPIPGWLGLQTDYSFADFGIASLKDIKFFDFIDTTSGTVGPMGPIALLLSLLIPLSIFLFFYIAYTQRTKEIIKSRDYTKILENEFNNSLFQLGNRIGDGMPAELAFGKLSEATKGTVTQDFFRLVNSNIQSLGMSLEKAIFDPKRGALISYSSNLISTSMHILVESVKKGLRVAAESLMSISDYVKNINKINDRLRDLLADVISDMKSNMTFLAPLLAGIVIGLASMITLILGKLTSVVSTAIASGQGTGGYGSIATIVDLFKVENMIPPYILQICVGIYIIQITFILTKTLVTVDAGQDQLKETYEIGKNLLSAGLLYILVALGAIVLLSIIASVALGGLTLG